ncbi:MAG: hypothetical protein V9G98_17125 [Candidatus Competibacter sp.]
MSNATRRFFLQPLGGIHPLEPTHPTPFRRFPRIQTALRAT